MLRFCVYIWKKSNPDGPDRTLYVGASQTGVRRFSGHHVLPFTYGPDDYIELFPCSSYDEALLLEGRLIRELKPKYNKIIPLAGDSSPVTREVVEHRIVSGRKRLYFRGKLAAPWLKSRKRPKPPTETPE